MASQSLTRTCGTTAAAAQHQHFLLPVHREPCQQSSCLPTSDSYQLSVRPCFSRHKTNQRLHRHRLPVARNQLGDQLLDYVTAGPKLRKWYGQGERLPKDGGEPSPQDEPEDEHAGEWIVVTDAETAIGEQVILQLILARAPIKVLAKDTAAIKTAYGPYVTPISADISNLKVMKAALKGAKTLVCLGQLGTLLEAAREAKVQQVLMLAVTGGKQGLFGAFQSSEARTLQDTSRLQQLDNYALPASLVTVKDITDARGGQSKLVLAEQGPAGQGVSREDLAAVLCAAALTPATKRRLFQVANGGPGRPPSAEEWPQVLQAWEQQA